MPQPTLKQRVESLEKQIAQMQAQQTNGPGREDWRQTVGMFTDDPGMLELFAQAMSLREADRQRARRKTRKTRA
jgi:hypothetical protein